MRHIPVLQREVLEYLAPESNQNFIDCTIGEGGHSFAILEKTAPQGKILGIDATPELIKSLKSKVKSLKLNQRFRLVCDNFVNLKKIVEKENFKKVAGILFDLGMSSWHLEESGRGFTFQREEPLDMRYNPTQQKLTAKEIINDWPQKDLVKILKEYGQERFVRRIARKIIEERKTKPIKTTFQLVKIIKKATPSWYQYKKLHFATRTFQALRIAVNDELENLKKVLPQALEVLNSKGRLVIISFHSLEDRIVKNFFKKSIADTSGNLMILNKKPVRPTKEEILINPRSRSAKLRAAIKL